MSISRVPHIHNRFACLEQALYALHEQVLPDVFASLGADLPPGGPPYDGRLSQAADTLEDLCKEIAADHPRLPVQLVSLAVLETVFARLT